MRTGRQSAPGHFVTPPSSVRVTRVNCVTCGASNDAGTKFCLECGSRLGLTCSNCASPLKDGARFCGECGTPVAAGAVGSAVLAEEDSESRKVRVEAVAERRLVTILFADLVGFTPFVEERDAEEVRETLSRYFELAKDVVGRYGGTIEKFIGDAVMAVWGTPTAHEDDAERAVRAALDLVETVSSLGPALQARAGLLTGEAVVTLGATDQGMVAGDLVNTASRLQSVAPPGAVVVGEVTHRAASKAIVFEPVGEQHLKGKSAPVPAWRALRVVAERGGRNRAEALEAPFVGREPELRLLKDFFHATSRERRARLVSITGVAGIGKTRLAWEFEKYLDGLVETVRWHSGRSPSYGEGVTFWALGEMVRSRTGLSERDDHETTRDKVAASVREWVTDESERRWIEAALLALLGAGDPPAGGRDALFAAWRTYFERIAARDSMTMVFQDLHWADAGMLDFIDHMIEWSRDLPIFIVTLARPELLERRPDWGAGKRNFTAIGLEPLAPAEMRDLLAGLVPGLPAATSDAIVRRADGIPLYAVEIVRSLVADGRLVESEGSYRPSGDLTHIALPETLHALIAGRMDSLDQADRSLLQDAAILGQSFTPAGLASITGTSPEELEPRLRSLLRQEVLGHKVDPRSPERGQFSFVQALFRDVAYNTLARPERKARHLAAARWFESLGEEELAGALAAHYLAAYNNAGTGPEGEALAVQARIALRAAGDRAAGLGSHEQAMSFYDQALTVSPNQVERVELLLRAASSASNAGRHEEAQDRAQQALEIEQEAGDQAAIVQATASLARVLLNGYRTEQALALLQPAEAELARMEGDPTLIALGGQLARVYMFAEQPARSVEVADKVLAAAEHANLIPVIADVLITKGSVLTSLGRAYEGIGVIRTAQALAEAHGLTESVHRALANRVAYEISFDLRTAFETARAALPLAFRMGWSTATLITNFAAAAQRVGEWDLALEETGKALQRTLELVDWAQLAAAHAAILVLRGQAGQELTERLEQLSGRAPDDAARLAYHDFACWRALAAGNLSEAYELWVSFAALSHLNAQDALVMASRVALWSGDHAAARRAFDRLEATGVHGPGVDLLRQELRAGLLALGGRHAQALPMYRDVLATLREKELPVDEVFTAMDMLSTLGPGEGEAAKAAQRARSTLEGLGAIPLLTLLDSLSATKQPKARAAAGDPKTSSVPAAS